MLITIQVWKEFVDERRPEEVEQSWEMCSRAIREYDNHMVRNWKEEIDTLLVFVCPSRSYPSTLKHTHRPTGWSVLGSYYCVCNRVLQVAPARPHRCLHSTPFPNREAVRRDPEPSRTTNSRPD